MKTIEVTNFSGGLRKIIARVDEAFSCSAKVKYGREATARKAARAMREKGNHGLEPYKCRHCPAWHIGHSHEA